MTGDTMTKARHTRQPQKIKRSDADVQGICGDGFFVDSTLVDSPDRCKLNKYLDTAQAGPRGLFGRL